MNIRHPLLQFRTGAEPLVGAAIGVGMTADAAVRGGADFLLALSAGRYRVMGAPSIAAMLPLDDANRFTDHFARREILDRSDVPVFIGASVFDPRLDLSEFVTGIAAAGYHGIANFPTSTHFDGRFRRAVEEAGIGYSREIELLRLARKQGLATFCYAKTRTEILAAVSAEVDVLCLNFGWNAGGVRAVAQAFTLEDAVDRARRLIGSMRQIRPETLYVVEGGPIVSPDDMYRVFREAKADGYVGGSTLDRMPLETSVMQKTSAFKTIGLLQQADLSQSREMLRAARITGITGQSQSVARLLEQVLRVSEMNLPVLVTGEKGLGRSILARGLHALSGRRGSITTLNGKDHSTPHEELLFGAEADARRISRRALLNAPGATVIIENAGQLEKVAQRHILDWLLRGTAERIGGTRSYELEARLILIAEPNDVAEEELLPELVEQLQAARIDIQPLRDRPEDIPANARLYLEAIGETRKLGPLTISADGYRVLFAHDWKENTRELRRVVEQAAVSSDGSMIASDAFRAILGSRASEPVMPKPLEEKDWILDALRRHRFRRGKTAAFLGISRKTLYNKMRRFGLLD